jgi:hypothetical protein
MVSIDDPPTKVALTDEPMANVTGKDTGKLGANRLETEWTPAEIARAAAVVERTASGWADRIHAVKVLRALCDLTERDPDRLHPGCDPEEWGFLAMEIGEALQRFKIPSAQGWSTDPATAKDRMNDHWPKLERIWNRQWPTILDGLERDGISIRLQPFRDEGGGSGKNTKYGFRFDDQEDQPDDEQLPDLDLRAIPQVRYRRRDISGNRFVRWMSDRGLYLGGWGGKVFIGWILIVLIAVMFWLWLVLVAMSSTATAVAFLKLGLFGAFVLFIAYTIFGWQMRLVADRVALAPWILQPFSKYDDYLLELRRNQDATRNTMYLVRYVADCPICGAKGRDTVCIQSGRLEFFGRLVGRCNRAPNAHVFSFDHVSRQGRFLR